jgi:hypothetical protein
VAEHACRIKNFSFLLISLNLHLFPLDNSYKILGLSFLRQVWLKFLYYNKCCLCFSNKIFWRNILKYLCPKTSICWCFDFLRMKEKHFSFQVKGGRKFNISTR